VLNLSGKLRIILIIQIQEECQSERTTTHLSPRAPHSQNGNTITTATIQMEQHYQQEVHDDEYMEISDESQESQPGGSSIVEDPMANGRSTNGCSTSQLVGTPPTSTTIIDEPPVTEIFGECKSLGKVYLDMKY
jgi:hypothetical protein